jgi:hypothetical protein
VLKPRQATGNAQAREGFAGLLYSDDILKLGDSARERIARYNQELLGISTHEELYRQFTKSIVLISEVLNQKNMFFSRALMASVVAFTLLLGLMAVMGVFDQ